MLKEIRFHGRGGQGAVTAAMILSVAGFEDGKYTQAFPRFGVERRGAPVEAFTRLSDAFIQRKSMVYEPDYIVVLDSTLFSAIDVTSGIKDDGVIIVNTNKEPKELGIENHKVYTLDVSHEAMEILGRDIVNTAMLGAFSAFTGEVSIGGIVKGIEDQFSGPLCEKNKKLVEQVYERAKNR